LAVKAAARPCATLIVATSTSHRRGSSTTDPGARWALAVGVAAIAAVFVVLLLHSEQRRSGTDLTPNGAFIAYLNAGQEACQNQEPLPAGAAAVRMTIGTHGPPGPPVHLTWSGPHGEVVTSGGRGAGWRQGIVTIPITRVAKPMEGLRVCFRSDGPQPIALAGTQPDPGYRLQVPGITIEARLRYDYLRPGSESWLELLPTLAYRSTIARSGLVRHWAWVAAVLLMLFAAALALATIARQARS
jgi:hypothetical protein